MLETIRLDIPGTPSEKGQVHPVMWKRRVRRVRLAVPLRAWDKAWALALTVLLALTGCAAERDSGRASTPGNQPAAVDVMPEEEAHTASWPAAEATDAPSKAAAVPKATLAPTPTPKVVTPPAPLAALVDGEYIFLADYERLVGRYEQMLLDQGLDPGSEAGQAQVAQMRQEALEGMIEFALIEQGGRALGLSLGTDELQGAMEADIAAGGGEVAFEEWLKATDTSRGEYRELLRQALWSQKVLAAVSAGALEVGESGTHSRLQVAAFEQWLEAQRETAVIERYVGD